MQCEGCPLGDVTLEKLGLTAEMISCPSGPETLGETQGVDGQVISAEPSRFCTSSEVYDARNQDGLDAPTHPEDPHASAPRVLDSEMNAGRLFYARLALKGMLVSGTAILVGRQLLRKGNQ